MGREWPWPLVDCWEALAESKTIEVVIFSGVKPGALEKQGYGVRNLDTAKSATMVMRNKFAFEQDIEYIAKVAMDNLAQIQQEKEIEAPVANAMFFEEENKRLLGILAMTVDNFAFIKAQSYEEAPYFIAPDGSVWENEENWKAYIKTK